MKKEEDRVSLFADNQDPYIKYPIEATRKLLGLISQVKLQAIR